MPAEPLMLPEREEIRVGLERGDTVVAVAARLGRHRSTIGGEIARNGGRVAYRAVEAQARADTARARPKVFRLVASPVLAAHVAQRLRAKDSPMTIAVELAHGIYPDIEGRVSHEPIYRSVHAHGTRGLPRGLHVGCTGAAAAANTAPPPGRHRRPRRGRWGRSP